MGKVGDEALIQHYMSSPNRWSDGGGEQDIIGAVEIDDQEESARVGGVLASCRVHLQQGGALYDAAVPV